MEIHNEALIELVKKLIRTGREDDWWDFKECHHEDRAALLHDIICLANNRADRDSYLIFGVRDKTFEIIGVESDPHRKNQQNIVDFLSQKRFAGQVRPRVEVYTVRLFRADVSSCGHALWDASFHHVFFITLPSVSGMPLRMGDRINRRLRVWGILDFECLVRKVKPAHSGVVLKYE